MYNIIFILCMVWCHKRKIIFIHIPKTGGTTVEKHLKLQTFMNGYGVIKRVALQHFIWSDYKKRLGEQVYNNYTKFSIVRNPIERMISEYYWTPLPFGYKKGGSFDVFLSKVEEIVKKRRFSDSEYHDHYISQTEYIMDKNGKLMVDTLFKFEEFEKVNNYLKKFNNSDVKIHNVSPCKTKLKPSQKQIEWIRRIYNDDFVNFGYQ